MYAQAQPHDPIAEIFPDVFLLRGSMRVGRGMRISRNMTLLRHDGKLAAINAVRLSPAGEKQLESLGKVTHVIRLGNFHGLDDRYYVDRFGAKFWCQAESRHYSDPPPDQLLEDGVSLPVPDTDLFVFEYTRRPECALLVRRHEGILITCDSLQHWGDRRYCSILVRAMLPFIGFRRRTLIGPLWLKYMTPRDASLRADFERLLQLPFSHLVNAHGSLLRDNAHAAASAAVRRAFS
ncbi:MAG: hypothetical protein OET44_20940 [Gammaproteobacteria bacterium]|nr:hypothetical protein [Gammaproteobacteria bacterium]